MIICHNIKSSCSDIIIIIIVIEWGFLIITRNIVDGKVLNSCIPFQATVGERNNCLIDVMRVGRHEVIIIY